MASVQERLEKAKKKLESLKTQRKEIDENIKKVEANIENYRIIIDRAKFDELSDTLTATGLSLDEIIAALKSGNMAIFQSKVESEGERKNGE